MSPPLLPLRLSQWSLDTPPRFDEAANIQLKGAGFGKALEALWKSVGGSLQELLLEQTRLVLRRCVDLSPPFSSKRLTRMIGANAASGTARKVGEARVARDIRKVFVPVDQLKIWKESKKLRDAAEKRDAEVVSLILGKKWAGTEVNSTPDRRLHQSQRNRRGGVRRKPYQQVVLQPGSVEAYTKGEQKKVGYAKSGWKAACSRFGHPLPGWISRHNGPGFGIDETDSEVCRTVIGNRVSYMVSKGRELRIIELALEGQTKSMISRVRRILRENNKV